MTRSLCFTAVVALALAGCAANTTALAPPTPSTGATAALKAPAAGRTAEAPARKAEKVKIAVLLPLSGPGQAALIADTMKKAAELAVADLNALHLTLLVRDDKATPEGAVAAAQDAASQGAELILGPLFARSVQAAAPVARQANLPIIAFSNDKQVAGQGVSLLSFMAEPEVHRITAYAASKGRKRIAALIPGDAYGRQVEAALRAAAGRHGAEVLALETYPVDQANGMADSVRRLRDAVRGIEEHGDPIDVLFLPGGDDTLSMLLPQVKQAQFDMKRVQILGTGALDGATVVRDPLLQGAWFAAPDPKGWQDFSARFAKAHGHAPPRIASLAYDAVGLAAALSNGPDGARYLPTHLTRSSGFQGVDGAFRLAADGTAERALAVLEVQAFAAKVIDAAPATLSETRTAVPAPAGPATGGGILSSIPSAFPNLN